MSRAQSSELSELRLRARYRRILRFAARHLLATWWFELVLPRFGLNRITERSRLRRMKKVARQFHSLAIDLGGLMIKVGQFLSTRLDVLPPAVTGELAGLQDEVPPVAFTEIAALAELELGVPLELAFASVDEAPLAAASLGQVHRAKLHPAAAGPSGVTDVVLKIQRPGIDRIVDVDLRALRRVAGWLDRIKLISRRAAMPVLAEEFALTSLEEIDYLNEAANAERFAENFADNPRVAAPEVVWERTTRRVLTLHEVTAIKIDDTHALRAAGIDPAEVADAFAVVMFDQVFLHRFVHGDPHPGNVFVNPTGAVAPDGSVDWCFTFIDFGMMGEVPAGLATGLRRTLIAAASRDGVGMVDGIREVGVLLPAADTVELERAMTKAFARFGGMGFAELQRVDPREFKAFAIEFGDLVRALPFQFPENFLLVIRALSLTSGVCSSLNPQFNVWNAVEPYAGKLIRSESGNVAQAFLGQARDTAGLLLRLPSRLDRTLTRLEEGKLAVRSPEVERRLGAVERATRRVISAVLFAALFIGGLILRGDAAGSWLLALSVLPLGHALFMGWWRRGENGD